MPKMDLFTVVASQDMLKNPGKFYSPGHSDMGIPIPKTLVIWASPVALTLTQTQIAKVT